MQDTNNNQEGQLYIVGSRGYSAYEVAVQEGFEGTVDEWLASLKGEIGNTGPQGEPGIQGEKGETGKTPQLRAGQIETLEPNESAYVNIIGTPEYPILNMGIPKGEKGDTPDLTDYVKNSDYATNSKGGTVKISVGGATDVDNFGYLLSREKTYSEYMNGMNVMFISKGTLENVFTGKGFLTQHQDISGKLDVSKVKNEESTTAGDVYDVRYVNSLIGDISSVLDSINGESI